MERMKGSLVLSSAHALLFLSLLLSWNPDIASLRTAITGATPAAGDRTQLSLVTNYEGGYPDDYLTRFDLVIFQNWPVDRDPERVRRLKRPRPDLKVLFYRLPHGTWDWQENWQEINRQEAWFVHTDWPGTSGRRVRNADPNDAFYLMDFTNPDFRRYQINYILTYINRYGFDGWFGDGPPSTIRYQSFNPAPPQAYRDAWNSFVRQFLQEMRQALGPKLAITNSTPKVFDYINPGNPDPNWDDSAFLQYVDGTMIEGFAHAGWEPPTAIQGFVQWNWQQTKFKRNLEAGKYILVISGTAGTNQQQIERWRLFSFASYLLQADGTRAYYAWMGWLTFPEQRLPIGTPLRDAYVSNSVYQRDFTGGKVLVNPSDNTRTITLPQRYRTLKGQAVTQVTLPPWTGTILLNQP